MSIEKPVLERIPSLDEESYTQEQKIELEAVFNAYNRNLSKLVGYCEKLLELQGIILDYYGASTSDDTTD